MITCQYMLCADAIVSDKESNKVSVFNIFDDISAESFPAIHQKLVILCRLDREESDPKKIKVKLNAKLDEKIIIDQEVEIDFLDSLSNNLIITITPLVIEKPGKIKFQIYYNSTFLNENSVRIVPREVIKKGIS